MLSRSRFPTGSIPVAKRFYTIGLIVGFTNARKIKVLYVIGGES